MPLVAPYATYSALFTKFLVRQLLAVIQRDQRKMLDLVAGPGVLPSIADYTLTAAPIYNYPSLMLVPRRDLFRPEDHFHLSQDVSLVCGIAIQGVEPNAMMEEVQDYVRALDMIFNTLAQPNQDLQDFSVALPLHIRGLGLQESTPLEQGSVKELVVTEHAYGDALLKATSSYAIAGVIALTVTMAEV